MSLNDGIISSIAVETVARPNVGVAIPDIKIPTDRPAKPYDSKIGVHASPPIAADSFERSITLTPDINDGVLSNNYGGEYVFERVWVQPLLFALGFIVENSDHEIKIWNAWRTKAVQTTDISVEGQEGTDLDYPSLSDTIQVFGDTIYTLSVFKDGPPLQPNNLVINH